MRWIDRFSYAVGHVLNDLCASIWFTYTLIFFQAGIQLPTALAGVILLIGQVADAVATPIVGLGSDQSQNAANTAAAAVAVQNNGNIRRQCLRCWWPTGRMGWHLGGCLLVILSFPFIYSPVYGAENADGWAKVIYYAPFAIIFQIGWASIQISHLALMNDLTNSSSERVLLASMRYFFTVICNLAVYTITYFLLRKPTVNQNSLSGSFAAPHDLTLRDVFPYWPMLSRFSGNASDLDVGIDFGPSDVYVFRNLAFIVLSIGVLFTVFFQIGINRLRGQMVSSQQSDLSSNSVHVPSDEVVVLHEREILIGSSSEVPQSSESVESFAVIKPCDWFKMPQFLILCPVYMLIRLIVNISQVYITLYLLSSLLLPKASIALIPLTIYTVSAITSLLQQQLHDRVGREIACFLGISFVVAFALITIFVGSPPSLALVYTSSGLLGVGSTILLVTSLAMVGDLVGDKHQSTAAFVYGVMSFMDKLANGLVVVIIQILQPSSSTDGQKHRLYYQSVESYGIIVFVGFLVVLLLVRLGVASCTRRQENLRMPLEVSGCSNYGSISF